MIVRLTGILSELTEDAVILERDGVAREVLVPRAAIAQLAAERGRSVTLHTLEIFEGAQTSSYLTPRLIGFTSAEEKAFFQRFISVKGMGVRKALKALSEPARRVARWIQDGDVKALARLTGIGPRGAQVMVAELKGKLNDMALPETAAGEVLQTAWTDAQRDAITVLTGWGDNRADAERFLAEAARLQPDLTRADDWVRAAYRIKTGGGRGA